MKFIRNLKINNKVECLKSRKKVIGTITKLLPGAVVILNEANSNLQVIDINKVLKVLT